MIIKIIDNNKEGKCLVVDNNKYRKIRMLTIILKMYVVLTY